MHSKSTNKRAFSLLELMIVITIIALLAGAGVPNYLKYLQRAAITEAVSVLAQYKLALGLFWSIEERLPQSGDTLNSNPANLTFGVPVQNTETTPLPDSIESLELNSSGNGIVISVVLQGSVFSTFATNNRTLVLGAQPFETQLLTECGNFTENATAITDIGFTDITMLPNGCNYNGVSTWLSTGP